MAELVKFDLDGEDGEMIRNAIELLSEVCYNEEFIAGWWHNPKTGLRIDRNKLEQLLMVITEITEAVEGLRKSAMDDKITDYTMETAEVGDAMIRLFAYIKGHNLDVKNAFVAKLKYNRDRSDHKLENRAKKDGKSF